MSSHHLSLRCIFNDSVSNLKMHFGIAKAGCVPRPRGKPGAFLRSDHSSGVHWLCTAYNVESSLTQEKLENASLFNTSPLSLRFPRMQGLKFPGPSNINVQWGSGGGTRPGVRSFVAQIFIPW